MFMYYYAAAISFTGTASVFASEETALSETETAAREAAAEPISSEQASAETLPHLRRQRQSRHRYQQSLYRRHQSPQKHQLSLHRFHQSLLHQIIYLQ